MNVTFGLFPLATCSFPARQPLRRSILSAIHRPAVFERDAMFARKLGVPCQTCHTTIPRLNETGYKFRGFRLPEMIGKSEEKVFEADYFSARLQARYDTQVTNQPNGALVANVSNNVPGPRTKLTA
jgi:hypothetical protein